MDVDQFLIALSHSLSGLDFIEDINFTTEVFIVKGRANLKKDRFLQVYYNGLTGTAAFSLLFDL